MVGSGGKPVPNATFYLDTMRQRPINSPDYDRGPAIFKEEQRAGPAGLEQCARYRSDFDISASGYMKESGELRPAWSTVTLTSALVVSGTVRDADSGEPIPTFRLVTGFPQMSFQADDNESNGMRTVVTPNFPTIDRWTSYADGKFGKTPKNWRSTIKPIRYVFKVAAEGYAPACRQDRCR